MARIRFAQSERLGISRFGPSVVQIRRIRTTWYKYLDVGLDFRRQKQPTLSIRHDSLRMWLVSLELGSLESDIEHLIFEQEIQRKPLIVKRPRLQIRIAFGLVVGQLSTQIL